MTSIRDSIGIGYIDLLLCSQFVREFKQMVHGMNKGGVKGSKVHQFVSNPFYSEGSAHPDVPWNDVLRDIGRRQ